MALASEWSSEKNASIDWNCPEDVLANGFTFLQILAAHNKLAAFFQDAAKKAERDRVKHIFLAPQEHDAQVRLLEEWATAHLFTLRKDRWCRRCGVHGHTRRHCPAGHRDAAAPTAAPAAAGSTSPASAPAARTVLDKFVEHQQHLERLKLVAEKTKSKDGGSGGAAAQSQTRKGPRDAAGGGARGGAGSARPFSPDNRRQRDLQLFTDERRRGVVARMDSQIGIGFVRVIDLGEVKFFLERVDSGVKEIGEGDTVTFKVDTSRDYPLAVDVRLERPIVTREDTLRFVDHCQAVGEPMRVLSMLLSHRTEWMDVVRWLQLLERGDTAAFRNGVHALVELVTFVGNREPIHLPLLQRFLQLMTTVPPATAANSLAVQELRGAAPVAFYPELLQFALAQHEALDKLPEASAQVAVERLVEVSNFIILLRQFTEVPVDTLRETQQALESLLRQPVPPTCTRTVESALQRLERSTQLEQSSLQLIPAAKELAVPPPLPNSPFTPANLPVNGGHVYSTTEAMLWDQLRLLRADTFEATCRVLASGCFTLPDSAASNTADTLSDVEHAHIFHKVRYMGRVLTRDRDYSHPNSFILQLEPKSPKADLASQLRQGTAVCITTGQDRTKVEPNEVFWAVVSSCDTKLLAANMIVVSPCLWDQPLEELAAKLARNERDGTTESSVLLETPVFIAGYLGIARALHAFVGPMGMPLPMSACLVSPEAARQEGRPVHPPGTRRPLLPFIPPHCEHAYRELTEDVRSRFTLDAGQDAVMRGLPTTDVMLVQGPPGTGKSFIGCRVVEVYIRYKHLIDSGDILQKVSVGRLSSTRPKDLLPHVGPVVVITYKNHALDEFLVDLLESGLWKQNRPRVGQRLTGHTPAAATSAPAGRGSGQEDPFPDGRRLVRIGGRSREDRLGPHNLGALLRARSDKTAINSLNERIFTYSQRMDRLTKELHFLENGRVPRLFFERCLTPEQQAHLSYEDKDEWLSGTRYVGAWSGPLPDKLHYVTLLRTQLEGALTTPPSAFRAAAARAAAAADPEEDEDVSLSVFQEMKREDEHRDMNDTLHTTYLSAEASRLAQHPPTRPANIPESLQSPWSLDPPTRHEFYAYLIRTAIAIKARDCITILRALEDVIRIRNHAMDEAKLRLLQGADVVGLTTTGCAMNQNLLRSLRPSLLVVEEAAEVLESQLLACMTDSLQQVVLIGDHYQLQPKVDTFLYEKVNHLNLSMFERLARTVTPIRLTDQRRMHPELSSLVRPFYDPHPLVDHPLVLSRPFVTAAGRRIRDAVPGLAHRAFFWRHSHPEETAPGSRSKVNTEEVQMVRKLVQHLVHEGALQSSITVITPYLGQARMLRSALRMASFADIRVSTVDLYQGDENDIIILSLVRTEKLTEFIRMRNRLIVSCSRARFAMVIVGNDKLLHQSQHWDAVLKALDARGCVGSRLPITSRERPDDALFMDLPEAVSAAVLARAAP